jgi:glycosyltransferase involved in cell wall biosynthesis
VGDAWVISYIGTLSLTNHPVDLLLSAFAELVRDGENVLLLIVGGGPDKRRLETLAGQLGVSDRCRFTGRFPAMEIPDLLRLSAISTDPVEDDAVARARWPLKIVESMAAGVPVVTAAVGDRGEMLGDGRAGVLVAPGDAHALAAAIRRLIHDPAQMARLRAGCAVQIEQYDAGVQAARLMHFYERLRKPNRPAPHSGIGN